LKEIVLVHSSSKW